MLSLVAKVIFACNSLATFPRLGCFREWGNQNIADVALCHGWKSADNTAESIMTQMYFYTVSIVWCRIATFSYISHTFGMHVKGAITHPERLHHRVTIY